MAGEALPIDVACRVLGVTDSGFYAWRKRGPSQRSLRHVWVTEIIGQIHDQSHQTYGARRVHAELTIGRNITISRGTVEMLMQRANLKGLPGPRKRHVVHQTPTSTDLVDRNFKQTAPNRLWVTDITEHPTRDGKIYCAVVLDTFSRRVVGWSIDSTQSATLVTNALGMAVENRKPATGTIIHSSGLPPPWDPVQFMDVHPTRPRLRVNSINGHNR